jgi:hypothetical protein
VHTATGKAPYEIVFQLEPHYKNWLTLDKRKAALGFPCEGSSFITEADVEIEI